MRIMIGNQAYMYEKGKLTLVEKMDGSTKEEKSSVVEVKDVSILPKLCKPATSEVPVEKESKFRWALGWAQMKSTEKPNGMEIPLLMGIPSFFNGVKISSKGCMETLTLHEEITFHSSLVVRISRYYWKYGSELLHGKRDPRAMSDFRRSVSPELQEAKKSWLRTKMNIGTLESALWYKRPDNCYNIENQKEEALFAANIELEDLPSWEVRVQLAVEELASLVSMPKDILMTAKRIAVENLRRLANGQEPNEKEIVWLQKALSYRKTEKEKRVEYNKKKNVVNCWRTKVDYILPLTVIRFRSVSEKVGEELLHMPTVQLNPTLREKVSESIKKAKKKNLALREKDYVCI